MEDFDFNSFCFEKWGKIRYENLEDDNCASFFVCYRKQSLYRCKEGFQFNPKSQLCVENYECERKEKQSKKNLKSRKSTKGKTHYFYDSFF